MQNTTIASKLSGGGGVDLLPLRTRISGGQFENILSALIFSNLFPLRALYPLPNL